MESVWFLFWWCPLLSVDCFHKLCLSGTPSENIQAGWDLGNKMARGYRFDAKSVCPMGSYAWGISSVLFEKWGGASFLEQSRTLEYLRHKHNFPWGRLISRQTNNPWPSYSEDLNPPEYFLRGTWKTVFVKTIHKQERTSSEEKSDGFHKKWPIELWTVLMFELLLYCHTAARCMERT